MALTKRTLKTIYVAVALVCLLASTGILVSSALTEKSKLEVENPSAEGKLELGTKAGDLLKGSGGITSDVTLVQRCSIFTEETARVKEREMGLVGQQKLVRCVNEPTTDIAGRSMTGQEGKFTWRLSNYLCMADDYGVPISFVATPHSESPVCLTTTIDFLSLPDDVVVKVFTWDSDGRPASRIAFSWRCRVRTIPVVD